MRQTRHSSLPCWGSSCFESKTESSLAKSKEQEKLHGVVETAEPLCRGGMEFVVHEKSPFCTIKVRVVSSHLLKSAKAWRLDIRLSGSNSRTVATKSICRSLGPASPGGRYQNMA